ncbi:phosphate ABC transporter ATP-binding protein [Egicoccus sp. AB-alg6-2]|uniref:ABC transporter ATP-binding protein n=1 Tax=Egicoccus sp. AB-alg6-2 TaxID=3242692 RepID=UPI00359EA3B4
MNTPAVPALAARGIEWGQADVPILRGVDLDCPARTLTALVGPSGAGKSTLLRCLNRLEEPHAGQVLLDGDDIRSLDPRMLRRRVGMVFQNPVLFPGTIRDNLAFADPSAAESTLLRCLDAAHLGASMLNRPITGLSGGEAQRVTIARALVLRPQVLLLDEPTASLDRDATARVERLVRELVDDLGVTCVLVSHDLEQTLRVADTSVLLVAGQVVRRGPPDEVSAGWTEDVG